MIRGAIGGNFQVKDYKEEDVPEILKEFFGSLWYSTLGGAVVFLFFHMYTIVEISSGCKVGAAGILRHVKIKV